MQVVGSRLITNIKTNNIANKLIVPYLVFSVRWPYILLLSLKVCVTPSPITHHPSHPIRGLATLLQVDWA